MFNETIMNRIRWAIRWRLSKLRTNLNHIKFSYQKILFLFWYRDILGMVKGGKHLQIRQRVKILGPGSVYIGDNVRFGYEMSPSWYKKDIRIITKFRESIFVIGECSTINNNNCFVIVNKIEFGSNVKTGHDCQFFDSDLHSIHPIERHTLGDKGGKNRDIFIANNVMIGAQVTVGPGTEIGENSVVGIRTHTRWKNYPANFVISGNPARALMRINDLLNQSYDQD